MTFFPVRDPFENHTSVISTMQKEDIKLVSGQRGFFSVLKHKFLPGDQVTPTGDRTWRRPAHHNGIIISVIGEDIIVFWSNPMPAYKYDPMSVSEDIYIPVRSPNVEP